MKKLVFTMIIIAAIAVAFGTVGVAYAKSPNQTARMGNGTGNGLGLGNSLSGDGILHEYMISAYSEALNIPVADLEARLDNGETMAQIALSTGLTFDQFRTLMLDVRTQAIAQAVTDGVLTQAQADWMTQHGAGQKAGGYFGNGMYGMRQAGQGQFANPGCPYYTPTNP